MKYNIPAITKWIEALRSGEYQRISGRLKTTQGHCCLGVACEINKQDLDLVEDVVNTTSHGQVFTFNHNSFSLPAKVAGHLFGVDGCHDPRAKLTTEQIENLCVKYPDMLFLTEQAIKDDLLSGSIPLSFLNDQGLTFPAIADIIEFSIDNFNQEIQNNV